MRKAEVFTQMLNYTPVAQRRQNVNEMQQLHFGLLISYRPSQQYGRKPKPLTKSAANSEAFPEDRAPDGLHFFLFWTHIVVSFLLDRVMSQAD